MTREEMIEFEDIISDRQRAYNNLQDSQIFSEEALKQNPIENVADAWEHAEEKTQFYIRVLSTDKVSNDIRKHSGLVDLGFSVLDTFYKNAQNYLEDEKNFDTFAETKNENYRSLEEEMNSRRDTEYNFEEYTNEIIQEIEELDDLYWENWGIEFLEGWK